MMLRATLLGTALCVLSALPRYEAGREGRVEDGGGARAATPAAWLARLNFHRKLAGLSAVTANANWSAGARLHARYVVKNDAVEHVEDPANPWYTPQGAAAGLNGNVMGRYERDTSDTAAVDDWMSGPFHAIGMIDPQLAKTGFGSYRAADGGLEMAATLDANRGARGAVPAGQTFPIYWPNARAAVPITSFRLEYPDPLTSCPGFTAPSGLPVYLQIGAYDKKPKVTKSSFKKGGQALPHCVFHEGNYKNPDAAAQALGRAILDARDAIVLIPKAPLQPGATYSVSITANGKTTAWSFKVAANAK